MNSSNNTANNSQSTNNKQHRSSDRSLSLREVGWLVGPTQMEIGTETKRPNSLLQAGDQTVIDQKGLEWRQHKPMAADPKKFARGNRRLTEIDWLYHFRWRMDSTGLGSPYCHVLMSICVLKGSFPRLGIASPEATFSHQVFP